MTLRTPFLSTSALALCLGSVQIGALAQSDSALRRSEALAVERELADVVHARVSDVDRARILDAALDSFEPRVRRAACDAIAEIPFTARFASGDSPAALRWSRDRVLLQGFSARLWRMFETDSDERVRTAALVAVGNLDFAGPKASLLMDSVPGRLLLTRFRVDNSELVRTEIMKTFALVAVPFPETVAMDALGDPSPRVIATAALGLAKARTIAAVPLLSRLVQHHEMSVRLASVQALAAIGPPAGGAGASLRTQLSVEEHSAVRAAIQDALRVVTASGPQ